MNKLDLLKRCEYFRQLSEQELQQLAEMTHEEAYDVGECLGKQGRLEEKLFLIEDGLVGLYLELGPMSERLIQSASSYELVGLGAVLQNHRYTVTMKAIETTKALVFNGKELVGLCDTNPSISCKIYRAIAGAIATRLKSAYTQLMGMTMHEY